MEKGTPQCKLPVLKRLVNEGRLRMTKSAVIGARLMGLDEDGMVQTVLALQPGDFYKSMTTHADHRIWQDVYHSRTAVGDVYLKLTVVDDVLIVSFKEL